MICSEENRKWLYGDPIAKRNEEIKLFTEAINGVYIMRKGKLIKCYAYEIDLSDDTFMVHMGYSGTKREKYNYLTDENIILNQDELKKWEKKYAPYCFNRYGKYILHFSDYRKKWSFTGAGIEEL